MLTDDIFRVQLPLLDYATGSGAVESKMLVENRTRSIRMLAPISIPLIKYFRCGQDHIYVRGQFDDETQQFEARDLVEEIEW